ncbi:MAG: response regulator [Pseudotabrizicola sp.]|uniref:hybrid sensor histidine kinase/response regulator n=1 Tax=Pseudotabrizicola sp. TaxID=2939647 RepID=UPI002725FDCB|nr:ATP-binding protein [Pseudotabrizicola sp.]MDO9640621.1 response regulator [Pseudotabrizicola sp.]
MMPPERASAAADAAPPDASNGTIPLKVLWPTASIPLLGLIFAALVLVVVHGVLLLDRISTNRDADLDNRTWLVAQLEVEHKELRIALLLAQQASASGAEAGIAADREVRQAFDIYYSRILTVTAALQLATDEFMRADYITQIEASRDEMAALIDRMPLLRAPEISQLIQITLRDAISIREITSDAILKFTSLAEAQRREYRDLLIRLGMLMGVLFILMTVAVLLAMRISREAARAARRADHIAASLRRTFDASLDGVIVSDATGKIVYLNTAALLLFGWNSLDEQGSSIFGLLFPQTAESSASQTMTGPLCEPGQIVDTGRHRLSALHSRGHEFPIEVSIVSERDSDGRLLFIGFLRDITPEVQAETGLREARDQARRDAAAKSRFLAVMSHEMRTPLHGVLAALDLIDNANLCVTDRHFLATAQACGYSALDQIDEVLEVTRSGATEVTISAFDPPVVVAELLAVLRPLATRRGNCLVLAPPLTGHCPPVLGWRRGFLLVMRNLISNAVKNTSDGEIVVSLRCTPQADGRLAINVEVSDTGIGIDPADHDRIFHEFETLDNADRDAAGGVGLGLAIARSAIERMGSQISLDSSLGQGSRFSFRMVLDAAPVTSPAEAFNPNLRVSELPDAQFNPREILVVDDNPVNLALMAEMLQRLGHRPNTALDGPRALDLAKGKAFDLILMDINMPGMDGLATTRAIRAGGASAFCPVVGVTALVLDEDRPRILDAGLQDVLSKPLGLARLRAYLAEFFSDHLPEDAEEENFDEVWGLMGDRKMARMMAEVLHDAQIALSMLEGPEDTRDLQALHQALHRAAGSAAVVGAATLAESLLQGERAILAKDANALERCKPDIASGMARTIDLMQRRWPDHSGAATVESAARYQKI